MPKTIIAYDLGTGGNKASLYDADGKCLAGVFVPYDTVYPQAGWHEQRPADWWDAVVESTNKLLADPAVNPDDIECLAISGHSLGCVPLDADGTVLRAATPIWSDKRPTTQLDEFFAKVDPVRWYRLTGNGFPAPHYTVFKIMWYRDNEPEMFARLDKIIGTKDFVNYRLTGRINTDFSYASGSGVYDLLGWDYSDELIEAAGLRREMFPNIVPSTQILGELTPEAAGLLGLPQKIKVAAGGVDNSCMALGARNIAEGRVYTSLGSSSWIAVSSDKPLLEDDTKPYVFTHVMPGMFTSAIGVFSTGTSFRWLRDNVCANLVAEAEQDGGNVWEKMIAAAGASPLGAKKLIFNPSLAGGSSAEASPHIRGGFLGLDLGHTQADLIRAAMEGIAMNLRTALDGLRNLCEICDEMVAVGGGSQSPLWQQIYADALKIKMVKTNVGQEAGSLGAAAVAAIGAGLWDDFAKIDEVHQLQGVAEPIAENVEKYEKLLPLFRRAAVTQAELGDMLEELDL